MHKLSMQTGLCFAETINLIPVRLSAHNWLSFVETIIPHFSYFTTTF